MRKYLIKLLEERIMKVKSDLIVCLENCNRNVAQEYIDLRKEVQERISKFPDNLTAMKDTEFNQYISECAKKEDKLLHLMKNREAADQCWKDRIELESELSELQSALWYEKKV